MNDEVTKKKKRWTVEQPLLDPKWVETLLISFVFSFPAPSESVLSRIVACQDRVRMKNSAALAIQANTLCIPELLLYLLHAKVKWLWHHLNPNICKWMNTQKVQKSFPSFVNEKLSRLPVPQSLPNFETTIAPLEINWQQFNLAKLCEEMKFLSDVFTSDIWPCLCSSSPWNDHFNLWPLCNILLKAGQRQPCTADQLKASNFSILFWNN